MKKFTFLIDEKELEKFKKVCRKLDTDASKQLRALIREFIKKQGGKK